MQGWIWYTFGVPVTFVLPKTDLRPIVTLGWNFNSQCWCRGVGGFNGDGEANSRTLRRRPCCPRMLLPSMQASKIPGQAAFKFQMRRRDLRFLRLSGSGKSYDRAQSDRITKPSPRRGLGATTGTDGGRY